MKGIYLAGPDVFFPDAKERGKRLKQLCASYGFRGLFPLDNEIADNNPVTANSIRMANKWMIQESDILIANLSPFRGPEPDSGTVWELGYAEGLGKKVYSYSNDNRTLKEKTIALLHLEQGAAHDRAGMVIENFGLTHNLMYAQHLIADSLDGCLKILREKYP